MSDFSPAQDLSAFPLLNDEEGLGRVRGNIALYKRLLGMYTANNYYSQLAGQLIANDLPAAQSTAHTIKGAAANLSLTRLQRAALALETCLKTSQPYEEAFAAVGEVTRASMDAAQDWIKSHITPLPPLPY